MIRSMFSAISGLRNHQTMMDVVGNNIANVNTTGFKSSSVVFQDVLSQMLRGSGAPTSTLGGTSPAQVGLGARLASITTNFGQGALQRTGRATDLAIQGDGFFTVQRDGQTLYTRNGVFSVDALGRIVTQDGAFLQGWAADTEGKVQTNGPVGNLAIPVGDLVAPVATTEVRAGGNLPADMAVGADPIVTGVTVYDNQGTPIQVKLSFTKTAADSWSVAASYGEPPTAITLTDNTLTFDSNGELSAPADRDINIAAGAIPNVPDVAIKLGDAGESTRITQYASTNSVGIISQNGAAAGSLQSFSIGQDGLIMGTYSNGKSKALGQLALSIFANPEGLEKVAGSNFRETVNSGLPQLGLAGLGGRGLISSGTTEMSNVDLAQEFTNLIIAQRGFQANSRVISSADEMLQEIVNLKR